MSSSSTPHIPTLPFPLEVPDLDSFATCGCPPDPPCESDQAGNPGVKTGSGGVRNYDGKVVLSSSVGLATKGFGIPFSTGLSYNSSGLGVSTGYGRNWVANGSLGGLSFDTGIVRFNEGANSVKEFYEVGAGTYLPTYFLRSQLTVPPGGGSYTILRPDGSTLTFDAGGLLNAFTNPGGVAGSVYYGGSGWTVSASDGTDLWEFDYIVSGSLVQTVDFKLNSVKVRRVEYAYDGSGNLRTLKSYDWAGSSLGALVEAQLFTYHTSGSGLLRHVITPTGYRQMVNNGITNPDLLDPSDPTDEAILNDYAETEYSYDGNDRVDIMYTHGRTYSYAFAYTSQPQLSTSLNVWTAKTEITLPDNSLERWYFNRGGEVILKQVDDDATSPTKTWNVFYQKFQEDTGRLELTADAVAITTVLESAPTLVTLSSTVGLLQVISYNAEGRVEYTGVQEGTGGILNKKSEFTYAREPVSGPNPIYVVDSETIYRGDGSSDGHTTGYSYLWHSGTYQISKLTTTLPAILTGENGTGTAVVLEDNFDLYGNRTSSVDGTGTITGYTYDLLKGAVTQVEEAVGVLLHMKTEYTLDSFGRVILEVGPRHNIDINGTLTTIRRARWTYFKDALGEVVSFGGYRNVAGTVNQIVGPVTITRPNEAPPSGYSGYRQAAQIDAAWTGSGIPSTGTTFAQSTWVRWRMNLFTKADQLVEERTYFDIPGSGYGSQSTNYGKKLFAYDSLGRHNQTTCAGGTIDKTTFNAMSWAMQEELGTSAGLTVTRTNVYDDAGNLTKVTLPVDGTSGNDRVTDNAYDFRHRLIESSTVVEKDGGGTWTLLTRSEYDNRDLTTAVTSYHTSVTSGNRTAHQTMAYDALGRLYRSENYGVSSGGTLGNVLTDNRYYNENGRIAREAPAGSELTKVTQYDILGRPYKTFLATGSFATSDPSDVSSTTVVEQTQFGWDNGGNQISLMRKDRFDNATGYGELQNKSTQPKARISYIATYSDALGREQATANYGTNGGSSWTRPSLIPARSDTVLVTSTQYSSAGNVSLVTDPAGRCTCYTRDAADRLVILEENCACNSSSSSSSSSGYATDVRTTRYEYTDDSWLKKLRSDNAATGQQITEWVYGVTPGQGSALYSNRLVYQKKYPDTSGGSDLVTFTYNRQLETTGLTDQNGTVHAYAFDKLGRVLSDTVGTFGSGVDNTVNKLENGWNERGLLARAASRATSGGAVLNEIAWEYSDFNKPVTEYQEHSGTVNTGSSQKVEYTYADGSANTIRPTGIIYPDGTPITTEYQSALALALSRPDAVKDSGTTLAQMKYMGLRKQTALRYTISSAVEKTYENGGTSTSGDQYTGLDIFGRLVETIWKSSGAGVNIVNTSYGRNRVGGVTWKRDDLAHSYSVLTEDQFYWYDGLQQVYQHQRGELTPGGGPPYTGITNLQQTEVFSYDETGNWLGLTTTSPSLSQSRTHNKANEIATISGAGVPSPAYDPAGNMTTVPKPGAWTTGYTLKWDAWNRLVEVKQSSTVITANTYDALTRRIIRTGGGETREYYYDKQWRSVEEHVSGNVAAQYTWSPTDRWTMIRRKRSVSTPLDETLFVLKDYLDPAAVVDSGAFVIERFNYDAFGPVRFLTPSFGSRASSGYGWNFLFHAEFRDEETGFYNYGYRFYHPFLGRWLSRDPDEQLSEGNLYRMVHNNSSNLIDYLGLSELDDRFNNFLRFVDDAPKRVAIRKNRAIQAEIKRRADQLDASNSQNLPQYCDDLRAKRERTQSELDRCKGQLETYELWCKACEEQQSAAQTKFFMTIATAIGGLVYHHYKRCTPPVKLKNEKLTKLANWPKAKAPKPDDTIFPTGPTYFAIGYLVYTTGTSYCTSTQSFLEVCMETGNTRGRCDDLQQELVNLNAEIQRKC